MTTTPIPTGPVGPTTSGPSRLMIALIAIGGLLLLAIVAVIFLLIGQNSNGSGTNASGVTPTPGVTESAAPTPSASPSDDSGTDSSGNSGGGTQTDNSLHFTSFNYDGNVECDETGQAETKPTPTISWQGANASTAFWRPGDNEPQGDATGDNGYQVPTSGNQDDMTASKGPGEQFEFPCNHRQYLYVKVTLVASNGQTVSKTAKFTDVNWQN
jgi:hypothetical protein